MAKLEKQLSRRFDFKNENGETLSGKLELPASKPRAYAIYAHCFTCSKNILAATRVSKTLSALGIAVLRFDFTGLGNSEGDFANTNFSSNVQDLKAAYNAISEQFEQPQIMIGHSLGGAAVLKVAPTLDSIKAVVTIGAPSSVDHVTHLFDEKKDEIEKDGIAKVNLAGREFTIKKQFIDDLNEQDILTNLKSSKKAYLIMHSPIDDTVSVDHAAKIYGALKHPKSYISLDQADHLLMNPKDAEYAARTISTWVERYLPEIEEKGESINAEIVVRSRPGFKFTNDIYSKKHQIIGDEPKKYKGDDLGMNPYELLLSSLGACTSMTMKMYAERKGYDLQDIKVELNHKKEIIDEVPTDHITKKIVIEGNLTDEEREKIIKIAEKCPVNRTLKSNIILEST
jgi:putative redox protein